VIGEWYQRHTEAGRRGLPPHVTLLYPFVDVEGLGPEPARRIVAALTPFKPFAVSFEASARFPGQKPTLYLRPEPSAPFVAMIQALAAAFPEQPPYGGEFDEVTPHLTVAEGRDALLDPIERELPARLPVKVRVERIWLVVDTARGWQRRSAFPLL
jgi:2'-5' RNA ligase